MLKIVSARPSRSYIHMMMKSNEICIQFWINRFITAIARFYVPKVNYLQDVQCDGGRWSNWSPPWNYRDENTPAVSQHYYQFFVNISNKICMHMLHLKTTIPILIIVLCHFYIINMLIIFIHTDPWIVIYSWSLNVWG